MENVLTLTLPSGQVGTAQTHLTLAGVAAKLK